MCVAIPAMFDTIWFLDIGAWTFIEHWDFTS